MGHFQVAPRLALASLLIASLVGACRPHYTVQNAPMQPEQTGSYRVERPEIPAVLQFPNVTIGKVDTRYSEDEKEQFRRLMAVYIPNVIQESVGKRQVFAAVTRVPTPAPASADYIVYGTYDFTERLGTGGREWIPFYGTFGGAINEAYVRGDLELRIVEAHTGAEVYRRSFPEEHRDLTSVYTQPRVGYMQADYVGAIATDVIEAMARIRGGSSIPPTAGRKPQNGPASTGAGASKDAAARLLELQRLHEAGLISDAEYQSHRRKVLDNVSQP